MSVILSLINDGPATYVALWSYPVLYFALCLETRRSFYTRDLSASATVLDLADGQQLQSLDPILADIRLRRGLSPIMLEIYSRNRCMTQNTGASLAIASIM